MGASIQHYGTQHVLMHLLEEWRSNLDQNRITGSVLLDLPKAFGYIPHHLLIAKLNTYEFFQGNIKISLFWSKKERTICMHQ